ncbi:MAG: molybdate ABC transporter substrate-binding protein [Eubacteriales bacterium]|nr:molybdate ABC transporter substrate-binding protein [Eubacteriales bacterium]
MKKKIMGIGIGLLTMTAVIWGYQNYKKNVPDGNEAVQSEKTVKRQETESEKYNITGKKTDPSKEQTKPDIEKETEEKSEKGTKKESDKETKKDSLITKKKEKNSEKETEEAQYRSPLIQKKEEDDSKPEETEQEGKPLIQKKDPPDLQTEVQEEVPKEEETQSWPAESETEPLLPQEETQPSTEEQKETEWNPPFVEVEPSGKKEKVSVFVTAQLGEAADEMKQAYEKKNPNVSLVMTVAEENVLYQKIMNGEKCDIYLSGSLEYLETLADKKKINARSIRIVAEDPIVLIQTEEGDSAIHNFSQIPTAQDITIAQPDTELGRASREILDNMGIAISEMDYSEVGNANAVMASVSMESSEIGMVYGTDAADAEGLVEVIAQAPENLTSSPVYFYSGTAAKESKTTQIGGKDEFLFYLESDEAADILGKYGLSTNDIGK